MVLDDGPIGGGMTSRTTAHLMSAIDDRYYEVERLHAEIAETLKITPSRVCQLLWRAVERLRGHLGAPMMEQAA